MTPLLPQSSSTAGCTSRPALSSSPPRYPASAPCSNSAGARIKATRTNLARPTSTRANGARTGNGPRGWGGGMEFRLVVMMGARMIFWEETVVRTYRNPELSSGWISLPRSRFSTCECLSVWSLGSLSSGYYCTNGDAKWRCIYT